ncbi:MFS transporter [Streptomyces virginiae]|uniref:MFS transporter n=1 Tax=Streptomyces virginiae TaxID=1961 RepID=UPI0036B75F73
MKRTWSQYRSFDTTVRLLLVNQLTINLGFSMLMPYLAAHLSGGLALATWAVGLVLGVRNLSQQGMFLIGGMLADRFGHKPLIVAGCTLRTALFAGFTLLQLRRLPENTVTPRADRPALRDQAGAVLRNQPFWLFSLAMTGSYVLSFQVHLALPLETEHRTGGGAFTTTATSALFVVSGLVALVGQLRITAWCTRTWTPARCLTAGTALMGAAFLPHLLTAGSPPTAGGWSAALAVTPLLLCAGLLAVATTVLYPFEMDTVVSLAGGRWVATHYGLYNTVCGIGITLGNLATGALLDTTRDKGRPTLPWPLLALLGGGCAAALAALSRTGRLTARPQPVTSVPA